MIRELVLRPKNVINNFQEEGEQRGRFVEHCSSDDGELEVVEVRNGRGTDEGRREGPCWGLASWGLWGVREPLTGRAKQLPAEKETDPGPDLATTCIDRPTPDPNRDTISRHLGQFMRQRKSFQAADLRFT